MLEDRNKLYETWLKCTRLAEDTSTTEHEREAARTKAKELRAKLDESEPKSNAIGFRELVKEGKQLIEEQTNVNWKLGELASKCDKEYGAGKLQQLAEELEIPYSTLRSYRATFIAWPQKVGLSLIHI